MTLPTVPGAPRVSVSPDRKSVHLRMLPALPRVYRHFKGGTYTVLFAAVDLIPRELRTSRKVAIYVHPGNGEAFAWPHGGRLPPSGTLILVASNSTNDAEAPGSGAVVVYVSHELGKTNVRDFGEFFAEVPLPGGNSAPRFAPVESDQNQPSPGAKPEKGSET